MGGSEKRCGWCDSTDRYSRPTRSDLGVPCASQFHDRVGKVMSNKLWAAADSADDGQGTVRIYDARDNFIAELTPDEARAFAEEVTEVSGYAS